MALVSRKYTLVGAQLNFEPSHDHLSWQHLPLFSPVPRCFSPSCSFLLFFPTSTPCYRSRSSFSSHSHRHLRFNEKCLAVACLFSPFSLYYAITFSLYSTMYEVRLRFDADRLFAIFHVYVQYNSTRVRCEKKNVWWKVEVHIHMCASAHVQEEGGHKLHAVLFTLK